MRSGASKGSVLGTDICYCTVFAKLLKVFSFFVLCYTLPVFRVMASCFCKNVRDICVRDVRLAAARRFLSVSVALQCNTVRGDVSTGGCRPGRPDLRAGHVAVGRPRGAWGYAGFEQSHVASSPVIGCLGSGPRGAGEVTSGQRAVIEGVRSGCSAGKGLCFGCVVRWLWCGGGAQYSK